MIALKRADFLAPLVNNSVIRKIIQIAGKSTYVPASGLYALVKAVGNVIPNPLNSPCKYPDQPDATAEEANPYSKIKSHPKIQAINSPNVA